MLLQGIWEIDTGSGAGYKFDGNKFWWVKSVKDFDDNYWYGYVDISTGEKAMKMVGLTYDELQNSLPGMNKKNIFYTRLDPKIIFKEII